MIWNLAEIWGGGRGGLKHKRGIIFGHLGHLLLSAFEYGFMETYAWSGVNYFVNMRQQAWDKKPIY